MTLTIHNNELKLIIDDITTLDVDVVVNAANGTLLGGGGVDGAIHKSAGPKLLEECKRVRKEQLNGKKLPTGEAVITKGYNLPADYVIHTVGPIWHGGENNEEHLLKNCYLNSLKLSTTYNLNTIAFPSISTGVFGYPVHLAAGVALQTIIEFLQETENKTVIMSLFSEDDYNTYKEALEKLT